MLWPWPTSRSNLPCRGPQFSEFVCKPPFTHSTDAWKHLKIYWELDVYIPSLYCWKCHSTNTRCSQFCSLALMNALFIIPHFYFTSINCNTSKLQSIFLIKITKWKSLVSEELFILKIFLYKSHKIKLISNVRNCYESWNTPHLLALHDLSFTLQMI